jgi:hypothetical protein
MASRAEEELKQVWAEAYDAYMDVPGEKGAIYSKPIHVLPCASTGPSPAWSSSAYMRYPESVTSSTRLYCLTAWNPMGVEKPLEENKLAHSEFTRKMKNRVEEMGFPEDDVWMRYSFGFSSIWREPGLVIACKSENACLQIKCLVLEMARAFEQGAVYEYAPQEDPKMLLRKTLPVLSSAAVEADVMVTRCQQPEGISFAEPCPELWDTEN